MVRTPRILILSAIVAIAASYATTWLMHAKEAPVSRDASARQESVYDRVMRTGTIRCGYAVWSPFITKMTNSGELGGIYHDYVEALGAALGLEIEWVEETSFGPHVEALRTGRFDAMCAGDWPSAARARFIDYPQPVLYVPVKAYAAAGDRRFDNALQSLNDPDATIAVVEGSTPFIIAHDMFPKASKIELPELTDLSMPLLEVSGGKADVAFWSVPNASEFMARNPGKVREIPGPGPLKLFASSLAVAHGESRFRQMLSFATRELLYSGEIDRIINKYEKYPGSLYRVAQPYKTP